MFIFDAMFIIVPILVVGIFIFTFAMMLSPKLRGKVMSRQIKATKYMIDESKKDLEDIATTSGEVFVNVQKNIIDNNEESLKNMATKKANINKDAIEITTRAIRNGFVENKIYCKHCGSLIDEDSKFCKSCGKEQ